MFMISCTYQMLIPTLLSLHIKRMSIKHFYLRPQPLYRGKTLELSPCDCETCDLSYPLVTVRHVT